MDKQTEPASVLQVGYLALGGWCALVAMTPLLALMSLPDYWDSLWWTPVYMSLSGFVLYDVPQAWLQWTAPPLAAGMAWLCFVIARGIPRGETRWLRLGTWALALYLVNAASYLGVLGRMRYAILHDRTQAAQFAGMWLPMLGIWLVYLYPLPLLLLTRWWGAQMRATAAAPDIPAAS